MTNVTTKRVVYWVLLAVFIAAGLFGVYQRIVVGKEVANYGSLVPWGLWIALYTYLAGLAAGLYIFASLSTVFKFEVFKPLRRVASVAAVVALSAGLLHVWFDIGHMERFWEVFARPSFTSIMGLMPWVYTLFVIVVVVQLFVEARGGQEGLVRLLGIGGLLLAINFSGGEGALLGVLGSRPGWHAGLCGSDHPGGFCVEGRGPAGLLAALADRHRACAPGVQHTNGVRRHLDHPVRGFTSRKGCP
jgi:protein NrfD